jgi:hypothetical protein
MQLRTQQRNRMLTDSDATAMNRFALTLQFRQPSYSSPISQVEHIASSFHLLSIASTRISLRFALSLPARLNSPEISALS